MNRHVVLLACLALLGMSVIPQCSHACPNCYSDQNSSMAQGMNMAVLSLLGVTGGMLVAFGSFFVYLRKRALKMNKLFSNRLN